jgi:hypothetical protein
MKKFMNKIILLSVLVLTILSCDDGDIIVDDLDFPETLEYCEGVTDLIIYTIKDDPYESLSIKLPNTDVENLTTVTEDNPTTSLSANNTFNYRSYNGDPSAIFCNSLPPTSPTIINSYEATEGTVIFNTTLTEDDNDGIPAALENLDGDDDFTNDDTDGDGVPNYLDSDDDGDNVPTANENPDPNNDGDLSDAQDTDGDGVPDYLDEDDDNDGTITRNEDSNNDNDPATDTTDEVVGYDYLNDQITTENVNDVYRDHTKTQNYSCVITVQDVILKNTANSEELIYNNEVIGKIETILSNFSYTVDFN